MPQDDPLIDRFAAEQASAGFARLACAVARHELRSRLGHAPADNDHELYAEHQAILRDLWPATPRQRPDGSDDDLPQLTHP